MAIKPIINYSAVLLVAILLSYSCNKQSNSCSKLGYEYTYFKPGITYSPNSDSIPLGSQITIEGSAPKSFFDNEKNYTVSLTEKNIIGPLSISKLVTIPFPSFIGAIDDVELTPVLGVTVKDTIQFSQGQLLSFRTVHWDGNSVDSFRLKINIKPTIRGTFFINLGQQGNRDVNCALYKYFLKVKNSDQHFYLMTPITNGQISDNAANHVYCFKVY